MVISCFSFTEVAKRAADLMPNGGSMVTLTFGGSMRVMPNYNVMGVAKAALEASMRYLAADFGPQGIRVNAISPARCARSPAPASPTRASCFPFRRTMRRCADRSRWKASPGRRSIFSRICPAGTTGEIIHVDAGYNIISMPRPENLKLPGNGV